MALIQRIPTRKTLSIWEILKWYWSHDIRKSRSQEKTQIRAVSRLRGNPNFDDKVVARIRETRFGFSDRSADFSTGHISAHTQYTT